MQLLQLPPYEEVKVFVKRGIEFNGNIEGYMSDFVSAYFFFNFKTVWLVTSDLYEFWWPF